MSEARALAILPDPLLVEPGGSISFRFGRRTWSIIGAAALVAALVGTALTFALPERYVVTRSFLVLAGSNATDNDTLIRGLEEILSNRGFATQLKSRAEIDLPAETIAGMISVDRPALSPLLDVETSSEDLELAEAISAQLEPTLTAVFLRNQRNLPVESRIAGPIVQEVYERPIREKTYTPWWAGFLTGGVLAFVVGFVLAAFRQYRAPLVGSVRQVSEALDLPVLARVAVLGDGQGPPPEEAVLSMLAAIERLGARGPIHRLVVVGPEADVERSKLVLALGCAIARNFEQPVVRINPDLENSTLTGIVGADDNPGPAERLAGELHVDQTLLRLEGDRVPAPLSDLVADTGTVWFMPSGVDRTGGVLRMRSNLHEVLGALSGRYVVIIDGPQVPGLVPSAQLLAMSDATLVVVTEGSTSLRDARFTGDALRSATTSPVGAVVLRK